MNISASLIKELREKTGAGMMNCKKALVETEGNIENAIDWLRTKGLATAAKKSGRITAEGLVGVAVDGNKAAIIELNNDDKAERIEEYCAGCGVCAYHCSENAISLIEGPRMVRMLPPRKN